MKKRSYKKYIFIALMLVAAGIGIFAYTEYNRKPADLTDTSPQEKVDAAALVNMYDEDEAIANKKFIGKVIEVTGLVSEIDRQKDTVVNVMIGKEDDMHKVSCLLDVKHLDDAQQYIPGSIITVKGICTGYLLDVELNRCVIVKQPKK